MIIKPRLLIPFLPRIPISLQTDFGQAPACLKCSRPIGVIFLIRNQRPIPSQLQTGRAQMISQLIPNHRRPYFTRARRTKRHRLHQGNPLLIVHDVQAFPLLGAVCTAPIKLAVNLKPAEIDTLLPPSRRFPFRRQPLGHFPHPLPTSVIDVIGDLRGAAVVDHLPRRGGELVLEVPLHQGQMGHLSHVAVGVVGVGLHDGVGAIRMERGTAQPIAVGRRAGCRQQAGLLIGIVPLPGAAVGLVEEAQEVADRVVDIALGIAAQRRADRWAGRRARRRGGRGSCRRAG